MLLGCPASFSSANGVRLFVCLFVRLLSKCEYDIFKPNEPILMPKWHKWSTWQGRETINPSGQGVKSQRHMRPKIDLEAWGRGRERGREKERGGKI